MKHYSIMATDIFISDVINENGWSLGEPRHYEVNNCAWKSLIKVYQCIDRANRKEILVQPYYLSGDRDKMNRDSQSLNIALQSHMGSQYQLIMQAII